MRLAILAVGLVLAFTVSTAHGQEPASGQILLVSWLDGDADLYRADLADQSLHNLTQNSFTDLNGAWSPDGQQIVFLSDRDDTSDDLYFDYGIYVMDADGQNVRLLVDNVPYETWPVWSPDGTWIAYAADDNTSQEDICALNIIPAAGGERQTLFTASRCEDYRPRWSPDGTRLLLAADNTLVSLRVADASSLILLLDEPKPAAAVWSPDGSRIVFVMENDSGDNDLVTMNADGTGLRRLTSSSADEIGPMFLPDGQTLLFGTATDDRIDLYTYHFPDGQITQLTDSPGLKFWWTPSPDGAEVLFTARDANDEDVVYRLEVNSGALRPALAAPVTDAGGLDWRP